MQTVVVADEAAARPGRHPKHFAALTSLRGVAAWWVVFYHFREHLPQVPAISAVADRGFLAVDIFFVLSGFVLQLNYARYVSPLTVQGLRSFAVARFARIYPLHLFMCGVLLLNVVAILAFSSRAELGPRYDPAAYVANIFLVQSWGLVDPLTWNIPAWSISAEFAAYILFPAASLLVTGWMVRPWRAILGLVVGLAAIVLFFGRIEYNSLGADIARQSVVRCVLEVVLGMTLCRLRAFYPHWRPSILLAAAAALTAAMAVVPDYVCFPAACCALILGLTLRAGFWTRAIECRPLIWLGQVSYSTYMVHYFLKDWTKFILVGNGVPDWAIMLSYVALVAAASALCYQLVELPGRAWVQRQLRRPNYPSKMPA